MRALRHSPKFLLRKNFFYAGNIIGNAQKGEKMMYFFMDNSEFTYKWLRVLFRTDYLVLGGYLASLDDMKIMEDEINKIKENCEIPIDLPIKWNLKDDRIRKIYEKHEKLDVYKKLLSSADEIRLSIISVLNKTKCKLIMSAEPVYKGKLREQVYIWIFENILQRLGQALENEMQSQSNYYPSISIVMDWPGGDHRPYFQTYSKAYHFKQPGFFCGDLKALNMNVNFAVSTTNNSPHLQAADIFVGITKDFLEWVYKERDVERVKKFFPPLEPFFRKSKAGKIMGYGLIVGKKQEYEKVEKKIEEIKQIAENEIPF